MPDLEQRVEFSPAWHRVHEDPKQNYGVNGVDVTFALVEPGVRAVRVRMLTDWMLPATYAWWKRRGLNTLALADVRQPIVDAVSFHHFVEDGEECDLLGHCTNDAGYTIAEPLRDALINAGSEGFWKLMEMYLTRAEAEE